MKRKRKSVKTGQILSILFKSPAFTGVARTKRLIPASNNYLYTKHLYWFLHPPAKEKPAIRTFHHPPISPSNMPHHNNHHDDDVILIPHPCSYRGRSSNSSKSVCPAYCDCEFPKSTIVAGYKGHVPDLIKCRCGEDDPAYHCINWHWHQQSELDIHLEGPNVTFHPTYSQGTAIVRGEEPLAPNMMHFWEMRILTALSGTDVVSQNIFYKKKKKKTSIQSALATYDFH